MSFVEPTAHDDRRPLRPTSIGRVLGWNTSHDLF